MPHVIRSEHPSKQTVNSICDVLLAANVKCLTENDDTVYCSMQAYKVLLKFSVYNEFVAWDDGYYTSCLYICLSVGPVPVTNTRTRRFRKPKYCLLYGVMHMQISRVKILAPGSKGRKMAAQRWVFCNGYNEGVFLWSHQPHIFQDVANNIVRHVEFACAVTWPISCPRRSCLPKM